MPQREQPKSDHVDRSGDDFRQIDGIGPGYAQRLRHAGIRRYEDLARRTPAEIAAILSGMSGISEERIANRKWIERARELAGPSHETSRRQHYAAFHVEFLLESDNQIRRTKIRDHQTDARDAWHGWDEERLLSFFRDRIPLPATAALDVPSLQPTHPPAPEQVLAGAEAEPTSQPPPLADEDAPSRSLTVEELAAIRGGQRIYVRRPDEANSVRLTMRIKPVSTRSNGTFDFSAIIAARRAGGHDRLPVATTRGAIHVSERLTVEVGGPALPVGLYRLVATISIYPSGHSVDEPPIYTRGASGDLMQIAEIAVGT